MTRKSLRAVAEGEEPAAPKTITEAASGGTKRELLVAMRDRIAEAVENPNTPPRDLGTLTKRLTDVVRDLEALDAAEESDPTADDDHDDESFDAAAI